MQIRIDGPSVQEGDPQHDTLSHPSTLNGIASHESPARPAAYYGETDHPSSEDEDEALLQKEAPPPTPGRAEQGSLEPEDPKRRSSIRCLAFTLVSLVAIATIVGFVAGNFYAGKSHHTPGARRITMDHIFNETFIADMRALHWVPEAGDGVFSVLEGGYIRLVDLKHNSTRTLVANSDIRDENGQVLAWSKWKLSPGMHYILVQADHKKQWRHSSFGNYYVHNLETGYTHPIIPPSYPPVTSYATWSPTDESIAFVTSNDLYILPSPSPNVAPIRVTDAGNASLFHGIPDWVYEEEVFSSDYALWWSPDSTKVAFLRLDETNVDEYTFPIYNPTDNSFEVVPYTKDAMMKYPKPGYNNPLVSVHIFDLAKYLEGGNVGATGFPAGSTIELDWEGRQPKTDSVIFEVTWVANDSLILKEMNRNADIGNVVVFDLSTGAKGGYTHGRVVRRLGKDGEEGDDGWIECAQNIRPLPDSLSPEGVSAYLDIMPTPDGYDHIALFDTANSNTPRFLTSGKWEVTGGIKAIDVERGLVYFKAARSSTERHIYSVPIPTINSAEGEDVEPKALTDTSSPAYYDADFSHEGGFYLLSYSGPNIPWQKVIHTNSTASGYVLTDNANLNKTFHDFESPIIKFSEIDSDGYKLNVKEIRPPQMDGSGRTKYPVLFSVYGGPNSQMVNKEYNRDWLHYMACELQYVIVVVDGRGTGLRGRKLRNPVKGNLGFWETRDQVNAARLWAAKPYVDPQRIGIWGWSYGGFMSSKVVEANAGIHTLAMAVAPVTSWRLYDSIYTERYMNLPQLNPGGYINASISNVTGFHKVDYLFMHGSADDNVHFANSAHLLDMLTEARVRNFRFRMFTDSDHSIRRRRSNREVYEYMIAFLVEKWGKGARRRGW